MIDSLIVFLTSFVCDFGFFLIHDFETFRGATPHSLTGSDLTMSLCHNFALKAATAVSLSVAFFSALADVFTGERSFRASISFSFSSKEIFFYFCAFCFCCCSKHICFFDMLDYSSRDYCFIRSFCFCFGFVPAMKLCLLLLCELGVFLI